MIRSAIITAAALATASCGPKVVVSTPPAQCSRLVPQSWATGVEAAPVPQNDPRLKDWLGEPLTPEIAALLIGPWASGYVAADGQLDKANGRTVDAIGIVTECERMVNEARPD